ncbi:MAG: helix-turn-helix transcriptional regulator [Actinobacteria bacterium]|nr:helix-turn-helix transcriptional regulator [Actinomycetota bacterium]
MDGYQGWFFFHPSAVPERWRERAVEVLLVPLLPEEVEQVFDGVRAVPQISSEDERLAELVAQGISVPEIAAELDLAPRTVERRLARLREKLGVTTTAELGAFLSRRGF